MKYKHFISALLLFFVVALSANAAIGQWQTYLSYSDVQQITQSPNKVFALSNGSLFSLDKRDLTKDIYSKITGLSDNQISYIKYADRSEALFVVYDNSNIDILTPKGIYNMPDLQKKVMSGSKKINHIYFRNEEFAYLSTDFGILKINIKKKEFSETYVIGDMGTSIAVKAVTIWNDSIYAALNDKIYVAPLNKNLLDYQNWQAIISPENTEENRNIVCFDNKLFLLKEDGQVYVKIDQSVVDWEAFAENVVSMDLSQDRLNLTKENEIISYQSFSDFIRVDLSFGTTVGFYDKTREQFFAAAQQHGLAKIDKQSSAEEFFKPDGPALNDPFVLKYTANKLYVTTSATWISGSSNASIPGAVMIYDGNKWLNITESDISVENRPFTSITGIGIDPSNSNKFYTGTYLKGGVYVFENNTFSSRYNYRNSLVQAPYGDDSYQIVSGFTFDKNANLWMVQQGVEDFMKVLRKDGTWTSFYFSDFTGVGNLQQLLIDNNNYKWANLPRTTPGIFVFDDNKTIDDKTDDKHRFISSFLVENENRIFFTPLSVRCMVLDKDDLQKMWVGTDQGPIIISNIKNIFTKEGSSYKDVLISRPKVEKEDGTINYLLGNEYINDIAIDGANRKWLATRNSGVLLISYENVYAEIIQHFTTENSPLLSNNVFSIAIDPETGEVFFGTDRGLISYMSDASEGTKSYSNVYAYPNPVRENYAGVISIVGLIENSNVKITDVAGNLVYETTSNGGMAIWDGTNINGNRVSTGVYFAMCTIPDGSKSDIVKILIINK